MEAKKITEETLQRVKSMQRIDYLMYQELINQKQIIRILKLRTPRTIFVDEEKGDFFYLNPVWKQLHICGKFTESEVEHER